MLKNKDVHKLNDNEIKVGKALINLLKIGKKFVC